MIFFPTAPSIPHRRRWTPAVIHGLSMCLALIVLVAASTAVAGPPVDNLDALLRAGEFGPAMALAGGNGDRGQQDAMFRRIATAQARAGASRGAARTASGITNDLMRSRTMAALAGQPVGEGLLRGGGPQPDFEQLIDLIKSTVAPTSWDDVGGPGAIASFDGGVYVDTTGTLNNIVRVDQRGQLASLHRIAGRGGQPGDVSAASPLRMVSLPRLERELQRRRALGERPDDIMQALAGIERVQYVFVYPEQGDLIIAGPACGWDVNDEGRWISTHSGRPVLRLEDLVVLLRNAFGDSAGRFSCSIDPRQENLAQTKQFLATSAERPLKANQRARQQWLDKIQDLMGQQDITVKGIDPRTRAARVIVEADYHMKLVGMGLADGTLGVPSYLDSIEIPAGGSPPAMDVLRWWFTLNYQAVKAVEGHDAFQLVGQGVKVLSENEMLTARGDRLHTGKSNELTYEFARNFTRHFDRLAAKYPVYAELQNIFDLALITALIRSEDLPGRIDWHLLHLLDPDAYQVELGAAPTQVDTVVNHRVINRKHIVAGVSGGVSVDVTKLVRRDAMQTAVHAELDYQHERGAPVEMKPGTWWWDVR